MILVGASSRELYRVTRRAIRYARLEAALAELARLGGVPWLATEHDSESLEWLLYAAETRAAARAARAYT